MADDEKEKVEETPPQEKKKKSPLMLIIIIVIALAVIGGGGAVTYIMMKGDGDKEKQTEEQQPKEEVQPDTLGPIVTLDSFIVNLAGAGGRNYLKVEIALELSNEQLPVEIENKKPQVNDAILMILSTKTFENVITSEGKLLLKNELLTRLNSVLNTGVIKNVYFTSFVVQ